MKAVTTATSALTKEATLFCWYGLRRWSGPMRSLSDQPCRGTSPHWYWSQTLQVHEPNYIVSEKTCLAVVFAVKTLRSYSIGIPFPIYTDNASLQCLMNTVEPFGCLVRWPVHQGHPDVWLDGQFTKRSLTSLSGTAKALRTLTLALITAYKGRQKRYSH